MDRLGKLSKKLDLNKETIEGIIVYNHELNNLIPKKQLKTTDLNLTGDSLKVVMKISKALKVDIDAVIGYILKEQLKKENKL